MPIDPNIALSYRPIQIPNPLEAYANRAKMEQLQMQSALSKYQLSKAQRDDEAANALAMSYRGAVNPDGSIDRGRLIGSMAQGGAAGQIPNVQKGFADADEKSAKTQKEKVEAGIKTLAMYRDALVGVNDPNSFAAWRASLVKQLPEFDQFVPRDFNPMIKQKLMMDAKELIERELPKLMEVNRGGTVEMVDPFTGQPKVSMAKTMTPGERAVDARSRDANAISQGTKAREDSDNLRKEFNALPAVKNFADVAPIYNAAVKAPDTPAGDFAMIYGVGKILDPGSVVREGEMNMVVKSGSPAERVMGYLGYLQGNGRLTQTQRAELNAMLHNAVGERKTQYDQARTTYGGLATQRGYKPEEIFIAAPEVAPRPATKADKAGNKAKGKIGGVLTPNEDGSGYRYGF